MTTSTETAAESAAPEAPEPARKRVRRVARWVAGIVFALFLLANLLAAIHTRALLNFPREIPSSAPIGNPLDSERPKLGLIGMVKLLFTGANIQRPSHRRLPNDLGLQTETTYIESTGGLRLECWVLPTQAPSFRAVLFHGYGRTSSSLLDVAKVFHGLGAEVWMVNYRATAGSDGTLCSVGWHEAEDVRAAVDHLLELGDQPIVAYGFSMGAAALSRAIALDSTGIAGAILEGCYDRMDTTLGNRLENMGIPDLGITRMLLFWGGYHAGFDATELNPGEFARSNTLPTIVLNGEKDRRARPDEGRAVHEALRGPKRFHISRGLGHQMLAHHRPEEFRQLLRDFFIEESAALPGD